MGGCVSSIAQKKMAKRITSRVNYFFSRVGLGAKSGTISQSTNEAWPSTVLQDLALYFGIAQGIIVVRMYCAAVLASADVEDPSCTSYAGCGNELYYSWTLLCAPQPIILDWNITR